MLESDLPAVVELIQGNWATVLSRVHSPVIVIAHQAEATQESFREQMRWKQMFVVEDDGEVVATGALADFGTAGAPRHSISQFFVRSDLHRRGIGESLMRHLEQVAWDSGVRVLHVPSSRFAIPFYRRVGFADDEAQPDVANEVTWMTMYLAKGPAGVGGYSVRVGREADLEALAAIDTLCASVPGRESSIAAHLADGCCLIAQADGSAVGFATWDYSFFGNGFIPLILVAQQYRRRGIAARLLGEVEARCAAAKLFATANASNAEAQALLARAGFVLSGTIDNLDEGDPEVVFFKEIRAMPADGA